MITTKSTLLLNLLFCSVWNIAVDAQSLVDALRQTDANVYPLITGREDVVGNGFSFISSITLVQDTGLNIIVDTPTGTDTAGKMQMLAALQYKHLGPEQIDMVITTHGHPDHYGQDGAFPRAQHFFGNFVYTGNKFTRTEYENGELQLTPNVKLWQTPGHTPQDVSVIVSNVPEKGTVAIVGDLILSAEDLTSSNEWEQSAWDVQVGLQNRKKVVCVADHIVPGHGRPFLVTSQMKSQAQCGPPANSNLGDIKIGSGIAAATIGQMKMYPGSDVPLHCFTKEDCVQFPGFTNCVQSAKFNTLVCCSITSCP